MNANTLQQIIITILSIYLADGVRSKGSLYCLECNHLCKYKASIIYLSRLAFHLSALSFYPLSHLLIEIRFNKTAFLLTVT